MTKSVIPKKRLLLWSAVLCAVTLAIMIATLAYPKNAPFVPPPFEPNAVQGDPDPPESFAYSSLWQTGMNFTSGLCQLAPLNLTEQGIEMTLHFTNPSENRVWMKARILDANGDVLGETGLLRPGDVILTNGGAYPPDLIIGKVEEFRQESHGISSYASVRPAVDISQLSTVLVIKDFHVEN